MSISVLTCPRNYRAVRRSDLIRAFPGYGMLDRQGFVHLNTPARLLVDIGIPLLDLRTPAEGILDQRRILKVLVNAKVRMRQVERQVSHVTDRRVRPSVPGKLDAEILSQNRDLSGR